jgi:hypothetical protein
MHEHLLDRTHNSPDKVQEYQAKIRILHDRRNEVFACHRSQYFVHANVKYYLRTATGSQMKTYLKYYKKPIYSSIKEATKNETASSVLQFLGFSRTAPLNTNTIKQPTTHVARSELLSQPGVVRTTYKKILVLLLL